MARLATPSRATVLVVEDTPSMARLYQAYIEKEGHHVELAATGIAALERLRATTAPEVVVLDLNLPDVNGQEILAEIGRQQLPTSVVVVTADGSLKTAVEAMRAGAYDFIVKPFAADRLNTTIKNALERVRLKSTVDVLEETLGRDRFCGFVGASLPMQAVYRALEAAAPSNATVFVTGESGTGKELCAEAVHQLSARRSKPFIALNCGAIPKDLIESEIFGHVKGSFTGAVSDRMGAAKQADGGTLFLDEICEMQIDLQTKLLRFLQSGTLRAVGGSKLEHVDVRIVCATNRDPLTEVRAGRFREDLYYRLHVVPIVMPPLREREEDVVLVARVLLERYAREEGKKFKGFDQGAEAALLAYDWPGNVRELQNVLRHAVVMHDGERLTAQMLPLGRAAVRTAAVPPPRSPEPAPAAAAAGPARPVSTTDASAWQSEFEIRPLWEVEKAAVERAIALCNDNIPRAAAFLEVAPSTIYRKKQAWEAEGKG